MLAGCEMCGKAALPASSREPCSLGHMSSSGGHEGWWGGQSQPQRPFGEAHSFPCTLHIAHVSQFSKVHYISTGSW